MAEPLHVLLVDDDRANRDALRLFLEFHGCHVRDAGDGDAALAVLGAGPMDAVICDLGLAPPWSGDALAARIRAEFGPGMVLIAFSGRGAPGIVASALAAGFDRHVLKPCAPGDLLQALRERKAAARA